MSDPVLIVTAVVAGALAGLGGAAFMLRRGTLVDVPDERRLHKAPTPRGGGIGLPLAGFIALAVALVASPSAAMLDRRLALVIVLVWALPNGLLGLIDDLRPLRSRVKFAIQAALALAAVLLGLRLDVVAVPALGHVALPPVVAVPLSVLWLVWVANLYNFMDGLDALAATSGAIFLAGFAAWAAGAGLIVHAAVAAGVGGGLLGFLRYNRPPARIFMGDAGSLFVGAVLGGLALALARPDGAGISIAAAALLMGPFVWDTTYTIVRRFLRGDPMLPHKTHLYQRLALAGWSHGRVRALYLGLAVAFAAAALVMPAVAGAARVAILAGGLVVAAGLTVLTHVVEGRR